jgi:hypothetical protein
MDDAILVTKLKLKRPLPGRCQIWLNVRKQSIQTNRGARLDGLDRALAPTVCGTRMISDRDQRGQTRNSKMREPQPCLLALRVHKTRRHARAKVFLQYGTQILDEERTQSWRPVPRSIMPITLISMA